MFQHTAARRRLARCKHTQSTAYQFQHTAARRRLAASIPPTRSSRTGFNTQPPEGGWHGVGNRFVHIPRFNTQPPEGGWTRASQINEWIGGFNTQPPEGGWVTATGSTICAPKFQHTAARRRLVWVAVYYRATNLFQHTAARRRLGLCR